MYDENLTAHQWTPPVPTLLQYITNEDLFSLVTHEAILIRRLGFNCLAMSDFITRVGIMTGLEGNTPDTNNNYPMFMKLITDVNMTIINTLPISKGLFTRLMESSGRPGPI